MFFFFWGGGGGGGGRGYLKIYFLSKTKDCAGRI